MSDRSSARSCGRRRSKVAAAAAVLAVLSLFGMLLLAPAAQAASPPRTEYACYSGSSTDITDIKSTLHIKSRSKYTVNNDPKKGHYTTKGKRIDFDTGWFKKYFGKWSERKDELWDVYRYTIKLFGKKDGRLKLTCRAQSH